MENQVALLSRQIALKSFETSENWKSFQITRLLRACGAMSMCSAFDGFSVKNNFINVRWGSNTVFRYRIINQKNHFHMNAPTDSDEASAKMQFMFFDVIAKLIHVLFQLKTPNRVLEVVSWHKTLDSGDHWCLHCQFISKCLFVDKCSVFHSSVALPAQDQSSTKF